MGKKSKSVQRRAATAPQADGTWPLVASAAQFTVADLLSDRLLKPVLYALVFSSGFANLALEVIAPRLLASIYSATSIVWSVIIAVVLGGLSLGYYLGGRIDRPTQSEPFFWYSGDGR